MHAAFAASCRQPGSFLLPARQLCAQTWRVRSATYIDRAVAAVPEPTPSSENGSLTKHPPTGTFAGLPMVPPSDELINSAVRQASQLRANKKIKNEASKARSQGAKALDDLTKRMAIPLRNLVQGFPPKSTLHPFERALLLLTLGPGRYERCLSGVEQLRKALLEVGKAHAAQVAKAPSKAEALRLRDAGFEAVQQLYYSRAVHVEELKSVAMALRRLPVVDPHFPTVVLVGAPNVGKSSLVQALSSGVPEICDYPFTTRTIHMGHFFVNGKRHQVTDTPGLLNRPDTDRNVMENLTLACLEHLPCTVVFVTDLTALCGTSVPDQLAIRGELLHRFSGKAWLDVLSKADLLEGVEGRLTEEASAAAAAPAHGEADLAAEADVMGFRGSALAGDCDQRSGHSLESRTGGDLSGSSGADEGGAAASSSSLHCSEGQIGEPYSFSLANPGHDAAAAPSHSTGADKGGSAEAGPQQRQGPALLALQNLLASAHRISCVEGQGLEELKAGVLGILQ